MKSKKLKGKKSSWSDDADFRIRNRKWLRYSSNIARRVLAAIENTDNLSQKTLSEKVGVSIQYINKLLKGKQNLTLETIAKLSDAVGKELITFPEYKYSSPTIEQVTKTYVVHNSSIQAVSIIMIGSVLIRNSELSVSSKEEFLLDEHVTNLMDSAIIDKKLPISNVASTCNK